ncbi:nitroreductase family protein [Candidatus Omnitrophota bacterium]
MTVLEAIKDRYSVRSYLDKPVGEEDLTAVLEAAQYAQSAKNIQNWRFIVVRDQTMRNSLVAAAKGQRFVGEAPVVIVCCGTDTEYVMTCGQFAYSLDVAIAMENMALVAHERGLGTCWLGAFYEDHVKKLLDIPLEEVRVVGMLTLGHPAGSSRGKNRESLDEIVYEGKWDS